MEQALIQRAAPANKVEQASWGAVLGGDRDAFNRLTEPYLDELTRFAEKEIRYHQYMGHFAEDDLKAEDLLGETLIRAWRSRHKRPPDISTKAWLLGTLRRVIEREVWKQTRLEGLEALSLEAPVPPDEPFDDDQSFWEWHQPDDFTRWEDVIEGHSVSTDETVEFQEEETYDLPPKSRHVLLLHEEDRPAPQEVAYVMNLSVKEALDNLGSAREEVQRKKKGN